MINWEFRIAGQDLDTWEGVWQSKVYLNVKARAGTSTREVLPISLQGVSETSTFQSIAEHSNGILTIISMKPHGPTLELS